MLSSCSHREALPVAPQLGSPCPCKDIISSILPHNEVQWLDCAVYCIILSSTEGQMQCYKKGWAATWHGQSSISSAPHDSLSSFWVMAISWALCIALPWTRLAPGPGRHLHGRWDAGERKWLLSTGDVTFFSFSGRTWPKWHWHLWERLLLAQGTFGSMPENSCHAFSDKEGDHILASRELFGSQYINQSVQRASTDC